MSQAPCAGRLATFSVADGDAALLMAALQALREQRVEALTRRNSSWTHNPTMATPADFDLHRIESLYCDLARLSETPALARARPGTV